MQIDIESLAGPPAQAVTESGSGASMLVLGAQGAGAFGPMALGSVSRYATTHASCPVVVICGEIAAAHQHVGIGIGIGIGDLDTSADRFRSRWRRSACAGPAGSGLRYYRAAWYAG